MNELIGFEYCQPKVKSFRKTTINKLWEGELFVFQSGDIYKLCVKLPVNTFIKEGDKKRSINAYDIINNEFYDFYNYNEVVRFYGKIKIKGENVYRRANEFPLTTPVLYDVHVKLPNEIEKDAGINSAYKANNKYNVLTLYCNARYFNATYIGNENWEFVTHKSEASIENNCEVEIKIDGELMLGAEWIELPF